MKLARNRRTFESLALLTAALAAMATASPARAKETLTYELIRDHIVDIDAVITKSARIKPVSCVYEGVSGRVESSTGIGFCLYRNFLDGRKTNDMPGVIRAKVLLPKVEAGDEPSEVEIHWRPVKTKIQSKWWQKLTGIALYNKYRELKQLMTHYLENELIIDSRDGLPWRKLAGPLAEVPRLLGNEADPKLRRLVVNLNPGPTADEKLIINAEAYEFPDAKPALTVSIRTNAGGLRKPKKIKTNVSGRIGQ